jgi:hypothetical protein
VDIAERAAAVIKIVVFIAGAVVVLFSMGENAVSVVGVFAFAAYMEGLMVRMLDVVLAKSLVADAACLI